MKVEYSNRAGADLRKVSADAHEYGEAVTVAVEARIRAIVVHIAEHPEAPFPLFFFAPGSVQGWTKSIDWLSTIRARGGIADGPNDGHGSAAHESRRASCIFGICRNQLPDGPLPQRGNSKGTNGVTPKELNDVSKRSAQPHPGAR